MQRGVCSMLHARVFCSVVYVACEGLQLQRGHQDCREGKVSGIEAAPSSPPTHLSRNSMVRCHGVITRATRKHSPTVMPWL